MPYLLQTRASRGLRPKGQPSLSKIWCAVRSEVRSEKCAKFGMLWKACDAAMTANLHQLQTKAIWPTPAFQSKMKRRNQLEIELVGKRATPTTAFHSKAHLRLGLITVL